MSRRMGVLALTMAVAAALSAADRRHGRSEAERRFQGGVDLRRAAQRSRLVAGA